MTTALPLQPKYIPHCLTHVLVDLAVGTPEELPMLKAKEVLEELIAYDQVPDTDFSKSSCTLTAEQTQHMIDIEMWTKLTAEEVAEIRGVVKVFTNDEPWKNPPRARVISWTWSVNHDLGLRIPFDLFKQCGVRHLVHGGPLGATIDGKHAFNQFKYSIQVGMFHCVQTPLGWCRLNRAAMGARPSCFISDTALRVLAQPCRSVWRTYVDNLLLVADRETLRADLELVRERAEKARYTFNEDLTNIDALINEEIEFLGALLHFTNKTVALGDKVLKKLATVWGRRAGWTVRDFIVCASILVYGSNLVGRSMAPFQRVLQRWAKTQGECVVDRDVMKWGLADLPPDVEEQLEKWVLITLENLPMPVPEPGAEKHDFILATDACIDGWSGIIYSCKTGQSTVVRGEWPEGTAEFMKHSTTAEPMAVAAACSTFFDRAVPGQGGVCARVLHIGDNTPTVCEINRGYSTCEGRFLAEHLHSHYPNLIMNSKYYPGEAIPTDEPSRGLATRKDKLDAMIEELGFKEVVDMEELY
jgi:hypothetical protein